MDTNNLPDLSDWKHIDTWTIEEAAKIWGSIDPMDFPGPVESLQGKLPDARVRKAKIALRAFGDAICDGTLQYVEAWVMKPVGYDKEYVPVEHDDPFTNPSRNQLIASRTRVRQVILIEWCKKKGMLSMRAELRRQGKPVALTQPVEAPQLAALPAPMKGSTVEGLYRVVNEFPNQYPDHQTRPPKINADIRPWIAKECNVTEGSREAHVFGKIVAESYGLKGG